MFQLHVYVERFDTVLEMNIYMNLVFPWPTSALS